MKIRTPLLCCALLAAVAAHAQHVQHGAATTPYAGLQHRAIKALSAEEERQLLQGHGMQLALAAELNGYPGPTHVLEHAEALQLAPGQRRATTDLMDTHKAQARRLGAQVLKAERALDRAFAQRSLQEPELDALTQRIGALQAKLRAEHLRTHLRQAKLLTSEQIALYQRLRGYTAAAPPHQGHQR